MQWITSSRVETQRLMKNLQGRDVWLDIDATESNGNELNIEIQRADKGADRKRARYHSSILDAHLLKPNEDFTDLPETYVIFITENDVIGKGQPLYRIERRIEGIDEPFNDGEYIIYVNGADKNGATELGRLMHDFFCTNPDDMHFSQLADKVRYFKETEKGIETMCKVMEDMRDGVRMENAKRMLADGLSIDKTAEYSGLPIEKVRELAGQKSA